MLRRARAWPGFVAIAVALLATACTREAQAPAVGGPLLPELGSRQREVSGLELRGPGNQVLVTLRRRNGEWQLAQRAGWRADDVRIARYLALLAQARRVESKTDRAVMYPRIGVEDVADAQAGGTELRLSGHGIAAKLLIGKPHKPSGGRYVRLGGQAQSWKTDADVVFDPDPVSWLDRRVLSVPLARVERVRIRPRSTAAFALVSRDDRFRPDDAPSAAMRDSYAGDEIASALAAFEVDDVGSGEGPAEVSQELAYELVDGAELTVSVWREGQREWARLRAAYDEERGSRWAQVSGRPEVEARARAQVAEWSERFAGRRFLLPAALGRTLTLDHSQILEGTPPP